MIYMASHGGLQWVLMWYTFNRAQNRLAPNQCMVARTGVTLPNTTGMQRYLSLSIIHCNSCSRN